MKTQWSYLRKLSRELKARGVLITARQEENGTEIYNARANEEEQAACLAEAKRILETARKEKRKLTEAETKRFNEIKDRVEALKQEAKDAEWLQQATPTTTQAIAGAARQSIATGEPADQDHPYARVRVPAQVRAPLYLGKSGKPVYEGPDARRDAYVAGIFFAASVFGHSRSRQRLQEWGVPLVRDSMSEGSNSAGGYLVPDELANGILKNIQIYGQARQLVDIRRMLSDTLNHPKRVSGASAVFVGENTAGTASDPVYANVQLIAKKLMALTKRSSELDEDSVVDLGAELTDELAFAMAVTEDRVVFVGDGTGTDGGMTGIVPGVAANAGSLVTAATGQTGFGTITLATCRSVVSLAKKKNYQGARYAWYVNPVGKSECFDRLLDAGGGNSNANIADGAPAKFLSYPVIEITAMDSTLGANVSKVVALFGDIRQAGVFGDRRKFTVGISNDRYFEEDQIGIKGTERFAWTNHDLGDGSNPGAVVGLKTAAS